MLVFSSFHPCVMNHMWIIPLSVRGMSTKDDKFSSRDMNENKYEVTMLIIKGIRS